jgi:thiamine pyrophosphokinase
MKAPPGERRAIVIADGDAGSLPELDAAWPGWAAEVSLVVAADGGARFARPLGLRLDRWVGDGDSIDPTLEAELAASGVPMRRVAVDKDESDSELALLEAVNAGATDVTVLGALGGSRVDHALANVLLLAHPALAGRRARLLDGRTRVTLLQGPTEASFEGRPGDLVSLLPLGTDAIGVTTGGLRFELRDEPLPAGRPRGLSNVRTGRSASVSVRGGRLLVIESPATLGP